MQSRLWSWLARIMNKPLRADRVGVFIDCDGVSPKDAARALEVIALHGRLCFVRSYGNFNGSSASAWANFISRYGVDARHLPNLTPGKNATDIALTVDAVDVLLTRPIDLLVLVASDADFVPLVRRIWAEGKLVFAFGQGSTSQSFRHACDKFWDFKSLAQQSSAGEPSPAYWKLAPSHAEEFVLAVLGEVAPAGTAVTVNVLGQALVARKPGFDSRIYSRRSLSELLRDLPSVEVLELEGKRHVRLFRPPG